MEEVPEDLQNFSSITEDSILPISLSPSGLQFFEEKIYFDQKDKTPNYALELFL